jgi:hypothetical protein
LTTDRVVCDFREWFCSAAIFVSIGIRLSAIFRPRFRWPKRLDGGAPGPKPARQVCGCWMEGVYRVQNAPLPNLYRAGVRWFTVTRKKSEAAQKKQASLKGGPNLGMRGSLARTYLARVSGHPAPSIIRPAEARLCAWLWSRACA